jgi:hypothetical protein
MGKFLNVDELTDGYVPPASPSPINLFIKARGTKMGELINKEMLWLVNGKPYTTAAATNVLHTFERQLVNGETWVRPSRDPSIIAKWKRFQEMHLATPGDLNA